MIFMGHENHKFVSMNKLKTDYVLNLKRWLM